LHVQCEPPQVLEYVRVLSQPRLSQLRRKRKNAERRLNRRCDWRCPQGGGQMHGLASWRLQQAAGEGGEVVDAPSHVRVFRTF
jgi:hypothetical protein